jgi:hypothetical protein
VTIILNEDRVIPAIFETMIGEGVYADSWRKRALPRVSTLQAFNKPYPG